MKFILSISLLLGSLFSYGQKYNFQNFEKDEISAKYIYDFSQDEKGVLYAASSKGLLIYDGVSFKLLDKYDGLKDNFVSKIYIDKQNNIWLAYYEGGVTKLVPKLKGFSMLYFKTEAIISIFEEDSQIKMVDVNSKVGTYSEVDKSFNFQIKELFDAKMVNQISLENGTQVYNTLEGLYIEKNKQLQVIPETEFQYIKLLKRNKVTNTFVYELDGVITAYEFENEVKKLFSLDLKEIGLNTKVTDLVFGEKQIIVSTLGQGIFEINFYDNQLGSYSYINYSKSNGMLSDFVQSLFLDNASAFMDRVLWKWCFFAFRN